jgi:hypothetical protein
VLPVRVLNCFVQLVFGIRKGLADDGLGIGVRDLLVFAGRMGVWAYGSFVSYG